SAVKARENNNGSTQISRDSERRKQQLITMGKAKGFLTYDEVNDHMPEEIVSSEAIDDWLGALGDEGIEIVDGKGGVKGPRGVAANGTAKEAADAEDEDE